MSIFRERSNNNNTELQAPDKILIQHRWYASVVCIKIHMQTQRSYYKPKNIPLEKLHKSCHELQQREIFFYSKIESCFHEYEIHKGSLVSHLHLWLDEMDKFFGPFFFTCSSRCYQFVLQWIESTCRKKRFIMGNGISYCFVRKMV